MYQATVCSSKICGRNIDYYYTIQRTIYKEVRQANSGFWLQRKPQDYKNGLHRSLNLNERHTSNINQNPKRAAFTIGDENL